MQIMYTIIIDIGNLEKADCLSSFLILNLCLRIKSKWSRYTYLKICANSTDPYIDEDAKV